MSVRIKLESESHSMVGKLLFLLLLILILILLLLLGSVCFRNGRKEFWVVWRESGEECVGRSRIVYVLKTFFARKLASLYVEVARRIFGDRIIPDPAECIPRFTTIKTQADRIILNWQTPRPSSTLAQEQFELQVCSVCPGAGGAASEVREWEVLHVGEKTSFDYQQLEPGRCAKILIANQIAYLYGQTHLLLVHQTQRYCCGEGHRH